MSTAIHIEGQGIYTVDHRGQIKTRRDIQDALRAVKGKPRKVRCLCNRHSLVPLWLEIYPEPGLSRELLRLDRKLVSDFHSLDCDVITVNISEPSNPLEFGRLFSRASIDQVEFRHVVRRLTSRAYITALGDQLHEKRFWPSFQAAMIDWFQVRGLRYFDSVTHTARAVGLNVIFGFASHTALWEALEDGRILYECWGTQLGRAVLKAVRVQPKLLSAAISACSVNGRMVPVDHLIVGVTGETGEIVALWLCSFFRTADFGTPVASQNEVRRALQFQDVDMACTFSPLRLDDANLFLGFVASSRSVPHILLRYRPDFVRIFRNHVHVEEVRGYPKGTNDYYDQLMDEKEREAMIRNKLGPFTYGEVGPLSRSIVIPSNEELEIPGIASSFDDSALIAL